MDDEWLTGQGFVNCASDMWYRGSLSVVKRPRGWWTAHMYSESSGIMPTPREAIEDLAVRAPKIELRLLSQLDEVRKFARQWKANR